MLLDGHNFLSWSAWHGQRIYLPKLCLIGQLVRTLLSGLGSISSLTLCAPCLPLCRLQPCGAQAFLWRLQRLQKKVRTPVASLEGFTQPTPWVRFSVRF